MKVKFNTFLFALIGYSMLDDCGRKPSSLASIKAIGNKEVDSFTFDDTEKEWSAIVTKSDGTDPYLFTEYNYKPGEAEMQINPVIENGVTKYVPKITFKAEKLTPGTLEMVDELANHSYCGMTFICEDFYGVKWVIGWDLLLKGQAGLSLESGELSTGRGLSGEQGGDIILSCEVPKRPYTLAAAVVVPIV
jgi:hypothetical protein